jgi:hypothetical protein
LLALLVHGERAGGRVGRDDAVSEVRRAEDAVEPIAEVGRGCYVTGDLVLADRQRGEPHQRRLHQLAGHPAPGKALVQTIDVRPPGEPLADDRDPDACVDQEVEPIAAQPHRDPDEVGDPVEGDGAHLNVVKSSSSAFAVVLLTSA